MSTTGSIFNGTSRYSADFQQIIERSVAIASLPMLQLQSGRTALNDQSAALSAIDTKFAALQNAIQSLETATGSNSFNVSNSDGSVVMAGLSSGALQGIYTVEVIDIGSYTSAMSMDDLPVVTDSSTQSISSASSFTLTVDGTEYTITPAANTLSALAAAVNAETDGGVEATIVNIGSSSSPDYRLSLRSTRLGGVTVQLNDGTRDLLNTLATGTFATYKVNGQPSTPISSDSRTVTIAPGLTATLLKAGTANLTVSRSTTGISNALSSFVTAYNAAASELDLHRGETPGALSGHSLLYTLSQTLREIAGYSSGNDGISSLTALGLSFDDQGKLSLDMTAFSSATSGQFDALVAFLGSSTTNGFLKFATDSLDGLQDATDGLIKTAVSWIQDHVARQDDLIAQEQERIDRLQESLQAQMAAADALIASLELQVNYITGLFESMRIAREALR